MAARYVEGATTASDVLKRHEDEFFRVTNAKLNLLELERRNVISGRLVPKIENADDEEARELLFKHLERNADVAAFEEYCRMTISAKGFPKMQDLGRKMLADLLPEVSQPHPKRPVTSKPPGSSTRTLSQSPDERPQERSLESRCRTSSAALMILTVAAIIIFWPGMLVLINAHVNQAWKEMFAGQFQDSQQHTSPNTPAVSQPSPKQSLTSKPPGSSTRTLSQSPGERPQVSTSGTHGGTSMSPVPCDTQIGPAVFNENKGYIEEPTSETHGSTSMTVAPMPYKLLVISCVLLKDKVYVTGLATDKDAATRQVQVYSLDVGKWSTLPEAPNYNAPAAIINGYFTLIGGRLAKDGTITNIVCSWIEEKFVWVQILAMPTARLESGVCHHDNLLLVTGGVVDDEEHKVVNTVDVYNFSTRCWSTPKALELPKALRSHHLVVFEGNIYLAAGATTYRTTPEGNMRQFNHEAWRARWSDVEVAVTHPSKLKSVWIPITAPPVLRSTVVSYKNSLFSVGGMSYGSPKKAIYEFVDGEIVDGKVGNSWKRVGKVGVGRYRLGVVPLGSRSAALFVAGGYVINYPEGDETNEKSSLVEVVFL